MAIANFGRSVVWTHEVKVDDLVTFRTGKRGTRLVAEWPGLATLACHRDGSVPRLTAASGASGRTIGKLRRGYVRALLGDLHGQLGMHASAVALGGRAILFVGSSGAGKSTAAAQMCLGIGAQLLADDVALIAFGDDDSVRVLPSEREHWLNADSCAALGIRTRLATSTQSKLEVRASSIAGAPCPLAMGVVLRLDPLATGSARRLLRGGDAAGLLLASAIRFDVEDVSARRRELEQVTTLYRHAPFVELVRSPDTPCDVAEWVLKELERAKL